MGQRTQRDEKKGGRRKLLKESFRCRCDLGAEYFNVTEIRRGRGPFGHLPCILCAETFLRATQSRNYPFFTANALCPAKAALPQRTVGFYSQGRPSSPQSLPAEDQRCSPMSDMTFPAQLCDADLGFQPQCCPHALQGGHQVGLHDLLLRSLPPELLCSLLHPGQD